MPFERLETPLPDLVLVRSKIFRDERGYFLECYKESEFRRLGIAAHFGQDNQSFSSGGVIRGLHYQREPAAQAKLVRAASGRVWDVAVDLRRSSATFLRWYAVELTATNGLMLFIPAGFAHGFAALTDAQVTYKCSAEYNPQLDAGVRWNDPDLGIAWPISDPVISAKDSALPFVSELSLSSGNC